MKHRVRMTINGSAHEHEIESRTLLVHYIRETVGLTGTHIGCETSLCGACTVTMDGLAVKSCTVLAMQAHGSEIETIEGLMGEGVFHPVQEGFWEKHGLQCGYCTPGMIMAACQLLRSNPDPSDSDIRRAIDGNFCRCTGYQHIIEAVRFAAQKMKSTRPGRSA